MSSPIIGVKDNMADDEKPAEDVKAAGTPTSPVRRSASASRARRSAEIRASSAKSGTVRVLLVDFLFTICC